MASVAMPQEEKVNFFSSFNLKGFFFFIAKILYGSLIETEKYLVPGNAVEDHSLSPAGQYSPAPVIVQTTYNYRYDSRS